MCSGMDAASLCRAGWSPSAIWKGATWLCSLSVLSLCLSQSKEGAQSNAILLFVGNIPQGKVIPGSSSCCRFTDTEEELENVLFLLRGYFLPCFYRRFR